MTLARGPFAAVLALGLALRVVLSLIATPLTHSAWFAPFLNAVPGGLPDPWSAYLAVGGDPIAFPYGPPYILAFGPFVWLGQAVAGVFGAHLGLEIAVIAWEILLLGVVMRVAGPADAQSAAVVYWLSPITLYVGYWHGQLDVFPASLLAVGLYILWRNRRRAAGAVLGAAVAAKFSMLLPMPFVGLYLAGRQRLRPAAPAVAAYAALTALVFVLPACLSPGFRRMVLMTPETGKAFSLAVPIGPDLTFYLLPLAYIALLYWAWRVRRLDFDLVWAFVGVAFMALLLLTPASPGWVMWAMPFITIHTARAKLMGHVLYWPFAAAYVALHLLVSTGAETVFGLDLTAPINMAFPVLGERLSSIAMTLMLAAGGALTIQMARGGVLMSPFYRASRKPFALGVAGDSGAGKDTLVDAVVGLFGESAVTRLSGDDYHIWDRQKPMWRALTHLNPKANDLESFASHVSDLAAGKAVRARHYDHASGRSGEPIRIRPQEVIAVSGLHALSSPALSRLYDVRVFLDMDESLRRFLKLRRDVVVRGHTPEKVVESIERRSADGRRFIQPQANHADLVFRLEPRHPSAVADNQRELDIALLRLIVLFGPGRNFDGPARLLTSLCGLQVIESPLADGRTEVVIEGEPTAADLEAAARRLAPDMTEFMGLQPVWRPGLSGVMQLIVLLELDRSRRRRGLAA